jgi:PIN domain nuclease of toxin-antitoxin system
MPGVLIDTQTLIEFLTDRSAFSKEAFERMDAARSEGCLAISVITLLELREMRRLGRLSAHALAALEERLVPARIEVVPIDQSIVRDVDVFPESLRTADRIVGATALAKKYTVLISANAALHVPELHVESPYRPTLTVK